MPKIRICTKCKKKYPTTLEYFHCDNQKRSGLRPVCKKCRSRYSKKYYQENRKNCLKIAKKYHSTINGHLRQIYIAIRHRCNNLNCKAYKNYGGRGIQNKFKSFVEFANYITNKLQIDPRKLQIDRIDNDGHYEKGNIRFVTRSENNKNRRNWKWKRN